MTYRRLGTSNLQVSALCLGTMMFGKQTPFDDAASIVASARDHGINLIDTADVYNHGQSEKDLGQPPPPKAHGLARATSGCWKPNSLKNRW